MMDNDITLPHYMRARAAEAMKDWLSEMDLNLFLTFNFNDDTSLVSGRRALRHFLAKVDRKLLGRHFNVAPLEQRTFMIAFPENLASNLHYHALLRVHDTRFLTVAEQAWQKLIPAGDIYTSLENEQNLSKTTNNFITTQNLSRIANYATKQTKNFENYSNFILASEFIVQA